MADITASMVKDLRERTGAPMLACRNALQETGGDAEAAIEILRKEGSAKAAKRAGKIAAEGRIVAVLSEDQRTAWMAEVNCETDFVARDENFRAFVTHVAASGLKAAAKTVAATSALPLVPGGTQTVEEARLELVARIGENIQIRRVACVEAPGCVGVYCHGDRIGVLVALDRAEATVAKDVAMHVAAMNPQALSPADVSSELIEKEKEIFIAQAAESGKPRDIIEKMVAGRVSKFLSEVSLLEQPFVKDANQKVSAVLKAVGAQALSFTRFEVGEGIEKETQDFAAEVLTQVEGTRQ